MKAIELDQLTRRAAGRRRFILFSMVFGLTSLASFYMADILWRNGITVAELAIWFLFTALTGVITFGFCQAMAGFFILNRGADKLRIAATAPADEDIPLAPTAIVIPIFNEDVSRVYEGLRVMFRSVEAAGQLQHFDFFICSDSNNPNQWIQEEVAWLELCKQLNGFGKVFYRKRRQAIHKKSGNVADFLRRWGRRYRYMVVLDADSVMTGDSLVQLVRMMEANPNVGIIQTVPGLFNSESLYARVQQFSSTLYGPIFSAGLNYWALSEGNYWGHNAIIRTQNFIENCGLPGLPGSEPLGGHILSHDYVEAALMRRSGSHVWLAYDLPGSFEEGPPTLIDAAKRDRRWCQGNLQHTFLLQAEGFHYVSRLHLLLGIMAYVSSPLWLVFLIVGTFQAVEFMDPSLVPTILKGGKLWTPSDIPEPLFLFTMVMLFIFLPKVVATVWTLGDRDRTRAFGGPILMVASVVAEMFMSMLLAPIQMLFHSKFVLFTILGQGVTWATQNRSASGGTDWRTAIMTHWGHTAFGFFWGVLAYMISPLFLLWLSPVIIGLVLSIPLSIFLSSAAHGQTAREWGLFLTPVETRPPSEIGRLNRNLETCYKHIQPHPDLAKDIGLLQAVLDPYINAVHVCLLRQRRSVPEESRERMQALREQLLAEGPARLTPAEKHLLLLDQESMIWLHRTLWASPSEALHSWWQLAMRQYNTLTQTPTTALYR